VADNSNPLSEPNVVSGDSADADIKKILARWSDLELLLERSAKADHLTSELQSYISELRQDVSAVKFLRNGMMIATLAYIVFINLLLLCLLFYHKLFFLAMGQYGKAILILVVFSSSVILIAKILGGLFRTHGDRNKDEMLPPHLKAIIEAYSATQN